jgi:hypothetical protein
VQQLKVLAPPKSLSDNGCYMQQSHAAICNGPLLLPSCNPHEVGMQRSKDAFEENETLPAKTDLQILPCRVFTACDIVYTAALSGLSSAHAARNMDRQDPRGPLVTKEITLPQAAVLLGLPWHAAHKLVMRGELGQPKQVAGRWLVPEAGVFAYLERRKSATPTVSTETATV